MPLKGKKARLSLISLQYAREKRKLNREALQKKKDWGTDNCNDSESPFSQMSNQCPGSSSTTRPMRVRDEWVTIGLMSKCSVCLHTLEESIHSSPTETSMEKQLSVIYLAEKVLKVPSEECMKYLTKYGDPVNWVTLCISCSSTLKNMIDISTQINRLRKTLANLNQYFLEHMSVKLEAFPEHVEVYDPAGVSTDCSSVGYSVSASNELRQYVQSRNNDTRHDEDSEDKDSCKDIAHYDDFNLNSSEWVNESLTIKEEIDIPSNELGMPSPEYEYTDDNTDTLVEAKNCQSSISEVGSKERSSDEKGTFFENNGRLPVAKNSQDEGPEAQMLTHELKDLELGPVVVVVQGNSSFDGPESIQPDKNLMSEADEPKFLDGLNRRSPSSSTSSSLLCYEKLVVNKKSNPKTYSRRGQVEEPDGTSTTSSIQQTSVNIQQTNDSRNESDEDERVRINSIRLADAIKMGRIPCSEKDCGKIFPTLYYLKEHINAVHFVGIKCPFNPCRKKFSAVETVENHVRENHHPPSIFLCSGCDKTFIRSKFFNKHLKERPDCAQKAVQCPQCVLRFSTQESLEVHIPIKHHPESSLDIPFVCSKCNQRYTSQERLARHEKTHNEKCFKCSSCESAFSSKSSLDRHIKQVHLAKEPGAEKFTCDICGRAFHNRSHYVTHLKLHGDESPYLCPTCGKTYKVSTQLNVHMWSHDPDRYEKYSLYKYGKGRTDIGCKRTSKKTTDGEGKTKTSVRKKKIFRKPRTTNNRKEKTKESTIVATTDTTEDTKDGNGTTKESKETAIATEVGNEKERADNRQDNDDWL